MLCGLVDFTLRSPRLQLADRAHLGHWWHCRGNLLSLGRTPLSAMWAVLEPGSSSVARTCLADPLSRTVRAPKPSKSPLIAASALAGHWGAGSSLLALRNEAGYFCGQAQPGPLQCGQWFCFRGSQSLLACSSLLLAGQLPRWG